MVKKNKVWIKSKMRPHPTLFQFHCTNPQNGKLFIFWLPLKNTHVELLTLPNPSQYISFGVNHPLMHEPPITNKIFEKHPHNEIGEETKNDDGKY